MMNLAGGFLLWFMAIPAQLPTPATPQRLDYCALVTAPERFSSRLVMIQARLTELQHGEWGLDSHCFQPMLLVLPDDVHPTPDFQLANTEGVRLMLHTRRERRVLFRGDFIGRFDLATPQSPATGEQAPTAFGTSRVTMRLVLRDIRNPERIVMPGK